MALFSHFDYKPVYVAITVVIVATGNVSHTSIARPSSSYQLYVRYIFLYFIVFLLILNYVNYLRHLIVLLNKIDCIQNKCIYNKINITNLMYCMSNS